MAKWVIYFDLPECNESCTSERSLFCSQEWWEHILLKSLEQSECLGRFLLRSLERSECLDHFLLRFLERAEYLDCSLLWSLEQSEYLDHSLLRSLGRSICFEGLTEWTIHLVECSNRSLFDGCDRWPFSFGSAEAFRVELFPLLAWKREKIVKNYLKKML